MKKYIYFDWNIFKYLGSEDSKYDSLRQAVENVKKGCLTPYSEAHIFDLLNNYDESKFEFVKKDLEIVTKYTENTIVSENNLDSKLILNRIEPLEVFNKVLDLKNTSRRDFDIMSILKNNPNDEFKVDMDKIGSNHPMYEFLKETGGIYSPLLNAQYLIKKFDSFFDDKVMYSMMRDQILMIKEQVENDSSIKLTPAQLRYYGFSEKYLNLLKEKDVSVLESKFMDAFSDFMKLSSKDISDLTEREKITIPYGLLDNMAAFKEKMKKTKLSNMVRDSDHAYYAKNSKYFVSNDEATVHKSNFIYRVLGIEAKAILMNEFIQRYR